MANVGDITSHVSTITPVNATGVSYQWSLSPNNSGILTPYGANGRNVSIQWLTAGTHTIILQASNACSNVTKTENITISALPTPQPVPVPVTPPVPVAPLYYELERCNQAGLFERTKRDGFTGLTNGTVVKLNDGQCYTIVGTSNVLTTNTIQSVSTNCSTCLGNVPTPQPVPTVPVPVSPPVPVGQPIPQPIFVPVPVQPVTQYWEFLRCDGTGLTERSVKTGYENISNGQVVKLSDNLCYTLIGSTTTMTTNTITQLYNNCSSCQGVTPTPQPVPVPIQVPVPVQVPTPIQVPQPVPVPIQVPSGNCVQYRLTNDNEETLRWTGNICGLGGFVDGYVAFGQTVVTDCLIDGTLSYGGNYIPEGCGEVPVPQPAPIPVPQPLPIPLPIQVPVPVQMAWNLYLCSDGSNATVQVVDTNLTPGVIIKDDNTGICYTVANMNPIAFTLITNHSEHQDCSSCQSGG